MPGQPLWINALITIAAGAMIWWAGARLEHTANVISKRTGLGSAFVGMLLLAGATSLPEVATTVTAVSVLGNPTLATHNLLGGVAMQTALLVIADRFMPRVGALSYFSPHFVLLIEGVGLVMLLFLVIGGVAAEGVPAVFSVSAWVLALIVVYVGIMYLTHRYGGGGSWKPSEHPLADALDAGDAGPEDRGGDPDDGRSMARVWLTFAGLTAVVFAGGYAVTHATETIAKSTGISEAFLGATLLAVATSLPELSTTISAARNERYEVAFSNIFGSNAFCVMLLFVADVLYRGDTILAHADPSVLLVTAVGGVTTCLYLWGLLERGNRTALRVGWDSLAVLFTYVAGMVALYLLTR